LGIAERGEREKAQENKIHHMHGSRIRRHNTQYGIDYRVVRSRRQGEGKTLNFKLAPLLKFLLERQDRAK
jgi:hypothetical protein